MIDALYDENSTVAIPVLLSMHMPACAIPADALILDHLLQVKYGLLSRADASIFMRFPPATYREKIWDHCAGFVIVEEAGGKVSVYCVCNRLCMLVTGGSCHCLQATLLALYMRWSDLEDIQENDWMF
jgi:hypothetical protein